MTKKICLLIFIIIMTVALPVAALCEQADESAQPAKAEKHARKSAGKKLKKGRKAVSAKGKKGKTAAKKAASVSKQKISAPAATDNAAATAQVREMRHWSNPDYTRIAVTLDREARFEYHKLPQNVEKNIPPRLYIDIEGARIGPGVKDIPIGDGLLKTARAGQYRPDTVRV